MGRIGSEVTQRATNEEIERNGFKESMDQVVLDVLLDRTRCDVGPPRR